MRNSKRTLERYVKITGDNQDISVYMPAVEYWSMALDNTCKENIAKDEFLCHTFTLRYYLVELGKVEKNSSDIFRSKLQSYVNILNSFNPSRLFNAVSDSLYCRKFDPRAIYFSYDFYSGASSKDSVKIDHKELILSKAKAWYDQNKKGNLSRQEKLALGIKCLAKAYYEVIKMQPILSLDKHSHALVIAKIKEMVADGKKPNFIRDSGFSYNEIKEAGVKVDAMQECGVKVEDLVAAGFTDSEIGIPKNEHKSLYDQQGCISTFPFNYIANELDEIIRTDKKSVIEIYEKYFVDYLELDSLEGDEIIESLYSMHFEDIVNQNKPREIIKDEFVANLDRCNNINKSLTNTLITEIVFFRIAIYLEEYFGIQKQVVFDLIYNCNNFKPGTNTGCIFTDIYLEICNRLKIVPETSVIDHLRSHVTRIWNAITSYTGAYGYHIDRLKILGDKLTVAEVVNGFLCVDLLRSNGASGYLMPCDLMSPVDRSIPEVNIANTLLKYIKDVKPGLLRFEVIANALNALTGTVYMDHVRNEVLAVIRREEQIRYNFNEKLMQEIYNKLYLGSFIDHITPLRSEYMNKLDELKSKVASVDINHDSNDNSNKYTVINLISFMISLISLVSLIVLASIKRNLIIPLLKIIFPSLPMISGLPIIHIILLSVIVFAVCSSITSLTVKLNSVINSTKPDKSISFDTVNRNFDKVPMNNNIGLDSQPTYAP